jgi:hypothetical protein
MEDPLPVAYTNALDDLVHYFLHIYLIYIHYLDDCRFCCLGGRQPIQVLLQIPVNELKHEGELILNDHHIDETNNVGVIDLPQ